MPAGCTFRARYRGGPINRDSPERRKTNETFFFRSGLRSDDGLRRGEFIVADRTNGHAAANRFGADAHSGSCSRTGTSSGSGTHANAGTNTNISDRTMGGRIA